MITRHILILLALLTFSNSQIVHGEIPEYISDLYDYAYESYLNEDIGITDFNKIINRIDAEISEHPEQNEVLFWKGKSLYLRGIAEIGYGDEKKGELYLNEAVRAARTIRSALPEQSYCLEAEAKAQIMLIKGIPYIIANGGNVKNLRNWLLK